MIPAVSVPTEGSFNGNATLTLPNPGDATKPGVCLGVKKINAVLLNLEACRVFVAKHGKKSDPAADEKVAKLAAKLRAMGMSEEEIKKSLE